VLEERYNMSADNSCMMIVVSILTKEIEIDTMQDLAAEGGQTDTNESAKLIG
jgi:hypothetical protein